MDKTYCNMMAQCDGRTNKRLILLVSLGFEL